MTHIRSNFLRAVIALDAAVCGLLGAAFASSLLFVAATGLSAAFARPLGVFLLAYALLLGWLAILPRLPRAAVWGLVAFNGLWALESWWALALGWLAPNALGRGVILTQAAGALGVGALQMLALRLARPRPV